MYGKSRSHVKIHAQVSANFPGEYTNGMQEYKV